MKYDVLYNFISPITGRVPLIKDYILIGGNDNFSIMSPTLIDIQLDIIDIRHDFDNLAASSFIIGFPNAQLPNSQVLNSLADGFMFNTGGIVSTTNNIPLPSLLYNNIWVGDVDNVATPTPYIIAQNDSSFILQEPNEDLPNAQALSQLLGGILKSAPLTGVISIATPDVDYATVATLEELAAEAAASAEEASAAALEATAAAGEATAAAGEATAAAAEASLSAAGAGISALAAAVSALAAGGSASSASSSASDASDSADNASSSATEAQNYLNTLLSTGLNALPCTGDVSFQGFKLINLGTPIVATDGATKGYVDTAIGNVPLASLTLQGDVTGSGPLNAPVITTFTKTLNQITNAGNVDIANFLLNNVLDPLNPQDGATKNYVDTKTWLTSQITNFDSAVLAFNLNQFAAPTASVDFNNNKLINVLTPTLSTDAANKQYVDSIIAPTQSISLLGDIIGSGQTGTPLVTALNSLIDRTTNQVFNFTGSPTSFNYDLTIPNSTNKTVKLRLNRANTGNGAGYEFQFYSPISGNDTFTFGYNPGLVGSVFKTIYSIVTNTTTNTVPVINYAYSLNVSDNGSYQPYNGGYGYLNSNGSVGQATGQNSYSINCANRIKASEFNAVSSKKIKNILGRGEEIEHTAIELFKKIPLFKYKYKDTIKESDAEHYGVIAEELAEVIPAFVNMQDEGWIPNIYKNCIADKGLDNSYKLYFDEKLENIEGSKLKLIFQDKEGEKNIEVMITEITADSLSVICCEKLPRDIFAYGTYSICPTVSKQKVFELGLVALQNIIKRVEILENKLRCT